MPDAIPLGRLASLELSARPSALLSSLLLWTLLTVLGWFLFEELTAAILFGLLSTLLHWLSEFIHHLGHARAAHRTGYPMTGVRAWFIFGQSLFPPDEPPLPGRVHIRRALGGPLASILLGAIAGASALLVSPTASFAWWILVVIMLDNWLINGCGALLPLGFTDGSTLLAWWGKP